MIKSIENMINSINSFVTGDRRDQSPAAPDQQAKTSTTANRVSPIAAGFVAEKLTTGTIDILEGAQNSVARDVLVAYSRSIFDEADHAVASDTITALARNLSVRIPAGVSKDTIRAIARSATSLN